MTLNALIYVEEEAMDALSGIKRIFDFRMRELQVNSGPTSDATLYRL